MVDWLLKSLDELAQESHKDGPFHDHYIAVAKQIQMEMEQAGLVLTAKKRLLIM